MLFGYLFRVLCFEYRIVTIDYFMDEMQLYELNSIVKNLKYVDRNQREIERYQLLVNIQANSKHKIKMEDVLPLPWDSENKNTGTKITEEQAKEMRDRMKMLEKQIQNTQLVEIGNGELMKNTRKQ